MTAQIADTFIYNGEQYSLIGLRGEELIIPEQFGMEPTMMHTACYCGFYSTYEIKDKKLILQNMTVLENNNNYLPINGVEPVIDEYGVYNNIGLHVSFTGKLRLAKDFIQEYYIHMGYQKATAFETVIDFTIKDGVVEVINDRSKEVAEKRGAFKEKYEGSDIIERIEDAFSLDLDIE